MDEISIFLAEGETHVRQAIRLSLNHEQGLSVIGEACHAEELLAQICQGPSDLLLLDWNLPGMHPQRIISVIQRYCPKTAVFATGVRREQGKAALAYGVDGFLLKGLPPEEFVQVLKDLIMSTANQNKEK